MRLVKLLVILALPAGAVAAPSLPTGASAGSPGLAALQDTHPCTVDHPGPASDADIERFIACYQRNQQLAAKTIAPYAQESQGLLDRLEGAREGLRAALGLGG